MENTSVIKKPSLFGMIYSPIKQMQKIKKHPIFWGALLSFCVLTGVFFGINGYYEISDPAYTNTILTSLPKEDRSLVNVENIKMTSLSFVIIGGVFGSVLLIVAGALALWVISRVFRGTGTFKQFFSFQVYLYSINILSFFVQALITVVMNKQMMVSPLSLAVVLPVDGITEKVLSDLDLFMLWVAVLLNYGMKEIAQFSAVKSWLTAALYIVFIVMLSLYSY